MGKTYRCTGAVVPAVAKVVNGQLTSQLAVLAMLCRRVLRVHDGGLRCGSGRGLCPAGGRGRGS